MGDIMNEMKFPNDIEHIDKYYDTVFKDAEKNLNIMLNVYTVMLPSDSQFFFREIAKTCISNTFAFAGMIMNYITGIHTFFEQYTASNFDEVRSNEIMEQVYAISTIINTLFGETLETSWGDDFAERMNALSAGIGDEHNIVPITILHNTLTKHLRYLAEVHRNISKMDVKYGQLFCTLLKQGTSIQNVLASIYDPNEKVVIECMEYDTRYIINGDNIIPCEPSYEELSKRMLLSDTWRHVYDAD